MDKPEQLDIHIIVNYPRLNQLSDEPIEALIRRKDGTIVHNVFGIVSGNARANAHNWIQENGYEVGKYYEEPVANLYDKGWSAGWRLGKRSVSQD